MRQSFMLAGALAAGAAAFAATPAQANFVAEDWSFTLGGSGSTNNDFDSGQFNVDFSVGYFFTDELEAGVRQNIGYTDIEGSDNVFVGTTRIYLNYNFDLDRWRPFLGGSVGYTYGDQEDSVLAGLEGGVKYFLTDTAFVYGVISYDWLLKESFSDDSGFSYGLGLGVRL